MKKIVLIVSFLLLVGAGLFLFLVMVKRPIQSDLKSQAFKPNLVFINVCSIRTDRLGAYGGDPKITPAINQFSEHSIVFENFITTTSWVNFNMGFFPYIMENPEVADGFSGYQPWNVQEKFSNRQHIAQLYSKAFKYFEVQEKPKEEIEVLLEPYKDLFLGVTQSPWQKIMNFFRSELPFQITLLFKIVHFPYSPEHRNEIKWQNFLSPESFALYQKYLHIHLSKKEIPKDKAPVFILLFGDRENIKTSLAGQIPKANISEDPLGLMNNPELLSKWQKSADYKLDLKLLEQAYNAKLNFTDQVLEPVLNGYSKKNWFNESLIIFAGDHGTAFMEHGTLHNGNEPYDVLVRVPLMIKVPGLNKKITVSDQISERQLQRLVVDLLAGKISAEQLPTEIHQYKEEFVLGRNCQDNIISVRSNSGWKFMKNKATGERFLFNWKSDPKETNNLYQGNRDMALDLEDFIMKDISGVEKLEDIDCPSGKIDVKKRQKLQQQRQQRI